MVNKINLDDIQRKINSRQLNVSEPDARRPKQITKEEWDFWETMGTLFRNTWPQEEGEEPTEMWGKLLTELSPEQIDTGFNRLLSWESAFPPNVLQFRKLCMPETISPSGVNSGAYIAFNDPAHPDYEPPRIESDEQKTSKAKAANKAISEMKGLFNTGRFLARFRQGSHLVNADAIDYYSEKGNIIKHEWGMGGSTKTKVKSVPESIKGYEEINF